MAEQVRRLRLDKWLWAARFFSTRARAKAAIIGGKVKCNGVRAKPSTEVTIGTELRIHQGFDLRLVQIRRLSGQRGSAAVAALLFEETAESMAARKQAAAQRSAENRLFEPPGQRPDRRDRRVLQRIKREYDC